MGDENNGSDINEKLEELRSQEQRLLDAEDILYSAISSLFEAKRRMRDYISFVCYSGIRNESIGDMVDVNGDPVPVKHNDFIFFMRYFENVLSEIEEKKCLNANIDCWPSIFKEIITKV